MKRIDQVLQVFFTTGEVQEIPKIDQDTLIDIQRQEFIHKVTRLIRVVLNKYSILQQRYSLPSLATFEEFERLLREYQTLERAFYVDMLQALDRLVEILRATGDPEILRHAWNLNIISVVHES